MHITINGLAKEGDGVGRCPDGKAIFVRGALPGEKVHVVTTDEKPKFRRAQTIAVEETHVHRVDPFCNHVHEGCGGCNLQHADEELQKQLKHRIALEAFERIGKFAEVDIKFGGSVNPTGYRTTIRCSVQEGKAGMRAFRSHNHISLSSCGIAHSQVEEIMTGSYFGENEEVVIRTSALTGKSLAVVSTSSEGVKTLDDVQVISYEELQKGETAYIVERVSDKDWRVSAQSFFQASPQGSELLVRTVGGIIDENVTASASMLDLYAGVGIFAGTVGDGRSVTSVEQSISASQDATHNLGTETNHVCSPVEDWDVTPHDFVIANPSRTGMSKRIPSIIWETGAAFSVLISCDAAAAARDARRMVDVGFNLGEVKVLDLFPQTSHLEVVSTYIR
ncbi:MAG: TRAM domain-containing protein [Actinomycetota bacterium]|nr:TRAM domain-containing protein [Actinomycetota bacterium]